MEMNTETATTILALELTDGGCDRATVWGALMRSVKVAALNAEWTTCGSLLHRAYQFLGVEHPMVTEPRSDAVMDPGEDSYRAAGWRFYRGEHPIQVEAARLEAGQPEAVWAAIRLRADTLAERVGKVT